MSLRLDCFDRARSGAARGAAGKRQQSDVAGALDGDAEPALMTRANAGHAARKNFAALLHKLRKNIGALVVDQVHFLDTKLADFLFTEELPLALSIAPNLVTIWLVANDFVGGVSYGTYIGDLNTLLQQLYAKTHARVAMANLPDLTRLPAFANRTDTQKAQMLQAIQHWNTGIAQAAAHYGVILVDLFSQGSRLTAHPEYISADGFHPSAAGYVQLAALFWQALES